MAALHEQLPKESHSLKVHNAVLNYELYPNTPNPSKPWLILIHGGNGTLDYWNIYMFGYNAIHELTVIGKEFTRTFFDMSCQNVTLAARGAAPSATDSHKTQL